MTTVPFLDIRAQDAPLRGEILERLAGVCDDGRFVLGPEVAGFEQAFAAYCEARHCVCVNSGTSALHLSLLALGVGPGDEVVTTPFTFVATAWAISYVGARPVFVDVDPDSRTLDADQLRSAITPWTRAVLPVHLYGQPADMGPILHVAGEHGLPVVEDACQAHGARYQGRRVGALGAAGCFSFYPGKNLGGYGEGGALVTDDDALAAQARLLRDHGQRQRYHHETVGFNYRMDAFQGAVLAAKLPRLDEWNERRRRIAALYLKLLAGVEGLRLPETFDDRESVYHLFVVELEQRDEVARRLRRVGAWLLGLWGVSLFGVVGAATLGHPPDRTRRVLWASIVAAALGVVYLSALSFDSAEATSRGVTLAAAGVGALTCLTAALYALWAVVRGARDPLTLHLGLLGGIGFAGAFALSLSWPLFEPMVWPGLALALALAFRWGGRPRPVVVFRVALVAASVLLIGWGA